MGQKVLRINKGHGDPYFEERTVVEVGYATARGSSVPWVKLDDNRGQVVWRTDRLLIMDEPLTLGASYRVDRTVIECVEDQAWLGRYISQVLFRSLAEKIQQYVPVRTVLGGDHRTYSVEVQVRVP